MNGTQIMASIKRGLGGLLRFSGRDTRADYWPYALFLIILNFAVSMVSSVRLMAGAFSQAFRAAVEGADGAAPDQAALEAQMLTAMMTEMQEMVVISLVSGAMFTLLMLAATARRLHDRDWSGWWLALPVVVQLVTAYTSWQSIAVIANLPATTAATDPMASVAAFDQFAGATGMVGTIAGLASWAVYILLLVQLVQEGTPGENRFGPGQGPQGWPD